jgi:excinuclease UvrABC nuclease subunit
VSITLTLTGEQLSNRMTDWWNGKAEAPACWYVYVLYDNDEPIYIGKTNNPVTRLKQHRADPDKQCVTSIEVIAGDHRAEIEALEIELITLYRPRLNRRGLKRRIGNPGFDGYSWNTR